MIPWIELHNSYSLYDHPDDIQHEKDLAALKQEVFRQRNIIESQAWEIHRLQTEVTLLRGMRHYGRHFCNE